MLNKEIVDKLVLEAKNSPVSGDVFHLFAQRKRTRGNISIISLYRQMVAAGFHHTTTEYAQTFKVLADVGLGTLKLSPRGKIRGIKDVKYTLQSIGRAACGMAEPVKDFRPRAKFSKLMVPRPEVIKRRIEPQPVIEDNMEVALLLNIHGKPLQVTIPKNFTRDDIAAMLNKLR